MSERYEDEKGKEIEGFTLSSVCNHTGSVRVLRRNVGRFAESPQSESATRSTIYLYVQLQREVVYAVHED